MTADRAAAFKAVLADLNSQFASWVASQAASSPHALWCDGARDYCRHAAALVEEFGDALAAKDAAPPPPAPLFGAFGGTAGPAPSTTAPAAPAGGLFGAAAPAGGGLFGAPAAGGLFGSAPPPAPGGGLFGAPPAGGGGGLFGAPPAAGGGAPLFSFGGATATTAAAAPPAAADDDDDAPADDGEATAAALDKDAAIAFKERAKFWVQTEGGPGGAKKWAERGAGVLTLRTPAGGRPHLVLTTDTGRVPLNAALYKGVLATKAKKPSMVAIQLANAAAAADSSEDGGGGDGGGGGGGGGGGTKLAAHLVNFGSEPQADAFVAALKEAEGGL